MPNAAMRQTRAGRPVRIAPPGTWTDSFAPANDQPLPPRYTAIDVKKGSGLSVALWGSAGGGYSVHTGGEGAAVHFSLRSTAVLVFVGNNDGKGNGSVAPSNPAVDADFTTTGLGRGGPGQSTSACGGGSTAVTDLAGNPIAIAGAGGGAGGPNYVTTGWKGGDAGLLDGSGEGGWRYEYIRLVLEQAPNGSTLGGGNGLGAGPNGYNGGGGGGGGGADGSGGGGGASANSGSGGLGGVAGANGTDGAGSLGSDGLGGYGKNDLLRPGWGGATKGCAGGGAGYGGGGGSGYAYTSGGAGSCLLPAGATVMKASADTDPNRGGAGSNSTTGKAAIVY